MKVERVEVIVDLRRSSAMVRLDNGAKRKGFASTSACFPLVSIALVLPSLQQQLRIAKESPGSERHVERVSPAFGTVL